MLVQLVQPSGYLPVCTLVAKLVYQCDYSMAGLEKKSRFDEVVEASHFRVIQVAE